MLAPTGASLNGFAGTKTDSDEEHRELIVQLQQLRGRIYLQDGAVGRKSLTLDHRHVASADEESWHLLTISSQGRVMGCARFQRHDSSVSFQNLSVRRAAIASSPEWGLKLRSAICAELKSARNFGFCYVELGGWALAEELRGTSEALQYVLATYAWTRIMGGALGITTATERNSSASILRRLGGKSLEWEGEAVPKYYDPHYNCGMEVLRFDSRYPNPKYENTIESLQAQICTAHIIRRAGSETRRGITAPSALVSRWRDAGLSTLEV